MYDALQQMDLSDEDEDDEQPPPALKPAPASKKPGPKVVYQLDTKSDTLMAIYCLLQDFLELRFTVRSTWHLFVKDNRPCADLMKSAATTQCANDIVHVLAQDFVEKFPHITSMEEILILLLEPGSQITETTSSKTHAEESPPISGTSPLPQTEHSKLAEMLQHTYMEAFNFAEESSKLDPFHEGPVIWSHEMSDEEAPGRRSENPVGQA
jgi:hypothetical protein